MSLLEIKNLRVEFGAKGRAFRAVDGLDLQLDQGQVLGIVGESGSGKSVAMMALMGLLAGQGRVTANLEGTPIDLAYRITDEEALPVLFDLIEHEGLVLGGSTAINVVGAMRLARDLGPGKTVVTVLCDGGQRYQSKLFNPAFLREKNLPLPRWMK